MLAPEEPRRGRDWPVHVAVLATMTGLSAMMVWPLLRYFKGHLAGWYYDTWVDTWTVYWVRKALWLTPHNPWVSPIVEYPLGADMYWHNIEIAKTAWGLLLVPLFGEVGTHNLLLWTTFPLAGYTAWLFVRYMLEREGVRRTIASAAAFGGACVFTFSRYHQCHAEAHLNLTAIEGIPLYLFFFVRYIDRGARRDLVGLTLAIVYTTFCDSYYLVYSAVISFLWIVAESARQGPLFRTATLFTPHVRRAAIVALTAGVVLSPWLIVLFLHAYPIPSSPYHGDADYVADLAGYFIPDRLSGWLPRLPARLREISLGVDGDNEEDGYFLGYVTPLLALIAARRPFMKAGTRWYAYGLFFVSLTFGFEMRVAMATDAPVWVAMAIPAFILATFPGGLRAGPRRDAWIALALGALGCFLVPVTANGGPYRAHLTMPYAVFKTVVPFFARGGMPDRFVLCATISLAILFAGFAAWVAGRIPDRRPWVGGAVALLFAAIPCLEYRARPMQMNAIPVSPPIFDEIKAEPPEVAVFTDGSPMSQYEQVTFDHPISYVRLARVPAALEEFERTRRVYQVMHHDRTLDDPVTPEDRAEMRGFLAKYRFRYYVTHFWDDARDHFVTEYLGGRLVYRALDLSLIVYKFDDVH